MHAACTDDLGRIDGWILSGQTPRAWKIRAAGPVFYPEEGRARFGLKKTACAELPWRAGRLQ